VKEQRTWVLRNTPAAESLTLGNLGFRDASVAMMVLDEGRNSRQRLPPFCFFAIKKEKEKEKGKYNEQRSVRFLIVWWLCTCLVC